MDPHPAESSRRTHSSGLRRDLSLLDVLADARSQEGLGVTQIAELTARDKAQVSRSLATLAEQGLVDRSPSTGRYRLGWRIYSLAARTSEARLVGLATPYLRRLVLGLHETTHLCVLRGGEVVTLVSELPDHAFRGLSWQGVSVSAHHTSAGRVLLSDWDEPALRQWWETHPPGSIARQAPPALRAATATSPPRRAPIERLEDFLPLILAARKDGYARVDEEFEAGLVGVSAAVFDFNQRIVAAINVSAPRSRLGPHLRQAGEYTRRTALELSTALGYRA